MASLKGRVTSLLAWGLLVGGVAVLATYPAGAPPTRLLPMHIPAAILFAVAGVVFGLSHPEGRAWTGGFALGWVPFVAGAAAAAAPDGPGWPVWLTVALLPGLLAGAGARLGAAATRLRS